MRSLRLAMTGFFLAASAPTLENSAQAQKWFGGDPLVLTLSNPLCSMRVRDRKGMWLRYRGEPMPLGRQVLATYNPREPEVVFFKLTQDSPFMFAAQRSCFENNEGLDEEDSNPLQKVPPSNRLFIYTSGQWFKSNYSAVFSEEVSYDIKASVRGLCAGLGFERHHGDYMWGGSGCFGYGRANAESDEKPFKYSSSRTNLYSAQGWLMGYYSFPNDPYAAGLELGVAGVFGSFPSANENNYVIEPATQFAWSAALAWRVYYDNWLFTPKLGFWRLPSQRYFELQAGYRFNSF